MSQTIDIEATPAKPAEAQPQGMAMARVESGAVGQALTVEELHERLEYVRQVMQRELREGTDYGKIPGTGDKPTLLQPGAQKLLLTFNLTECVKKEVLREYPGMHREYEFTVVVKAPNGKEWDGVGTCSTLETKYRWRKQERRCPTCGKHNIIPGKEEYGGGWLCWKKKGGCGATFQFNDPAIAGQPTGKVENPDPPDCWNTVRKMAFKRALVAAAINATNTSELWTQDLEETGGNGNEPEPAPGGTRTGPPPASQRQAPAPRPTTTPAPVQAPKPVLAAGQAWPYDRMLDWTLKEVEKAGFTEHLPEYLEAVAQLLPTENLQDWPLRFVPWSWPQLRGLLAKLKAFSNGEKAEAAFPAHDEPDSGKAPATESAPPGRPYMAAPGKSIEVPRDAPGPAPVSDDAEWFMKLVVPIPHKGEPRDEYLKHPDTIGSLFELRHGNDDESQAARQRLWGFVEHYEPKGWTKRDGTEMPPSASDLKFREALDAFAEWFKREHPDEKL